MFGSTRLTEVVLMFVSAQLIEVILILDHLTNRDNPYLDQFARLKYSLCLDISSDRDNH